MFKFGNLLNFSAQNIDLIRIRDNWA